MKNLVLIGFMGSGKSTVGKLVAAHLEMEFMDVDHWIEEKEGVLISEIFECAGEKAFRDIESKAVEELAQKQNLVLATGGGVVLRPSNLEALRKNGVLIHLYVDAETVLQRTKKHAHRPLLKTEDPLAKIKSLMEERRSLYEAIPLTVNTVGRLTQDVAKDVESLFRAQLTR
jgi:shikimate kinase